MKNPVKYFLNPKNFFTIAAAICMILAAACRCVGIIPQLKELPQEEIITRLALPVGACLLYAASVAFCGKKAIWVSIIPLIIGVLFFILRVFTDDNISGQPLGMINILLSLLIYIVITVVYTATVTGAIRTKFILAGIILLPLAYHAGVEDYSAIKLMGNSLTWSAMLMEAGILLIMLGLFFTALGLKKMAPVDPDGGRNVVPPLPGGGKKVSEPEPRPEPETEAEPETESEIEPETASEPEPVPVIIEEPEEAAFTEPEDDGVPAAPEQEAPSAEDIEPEREAAVPAERLSLAERLGFKKREREVSEKVALEETPEPSDVEFEADDFAFGKEDFEPEGEEILSETAEAAEMFQEDE